MKNIKSNKNLKVIEPPAKEDSLLRMKIKALEEQIEMLQKSNLNIFIPISQHEIKQPINYDQIINKLKTQILTLQQDLTKSKSIIKKLQNEKQVIRINHQNEIMRFEQMVNDLKEQISSLNSQISELQQKLKAETTARRQKQKQAIQLKVENRFLNQDLVSQKKRMEMIQNKYNQLHGFVNAVNFHTRIYKSKETKITAIETFELQKLKNYIQDLEMKIKQLLSANKQEKITLGAKKQNLGEEIVRLKKNIDLQLGLAVGEESTKSFLAVYNDTNNLFNELLTGCKK